MPFLTYDPLPQCLQQSPLTPLLLARGHQRGSRRYLSDVKCLVFYAVAATALLCASPCVGRAKADPAPRKSASVRSTPADRTKDTRPAVSDETSPQGGGPFGPGTRTTDPGQAKLPRIFIMDTL